MRLSSSLFEPGMYDLYQQGVIVGRLIVNSGSGDRSTVQDWLLSASFQTPTAEPTKLEFVHRGLPVPIEQILRDVEIGMMHVRADCIAQVLVDARTEIGRQTTLAKKGTFGGRAAAPAKADQTDLQRRFAGKIPIGEYGLAQQGIAVGKLLVEPAGPSRTATSGRRRTREHWLLFSAFRSPGAEYPTQEIDFRWERPTAALADFLSGSPAYSTYVIAECGLPSPLR